ncbi:MAG TPA: galactokinase [Candidatus Acidoferrum sp.]|nr:galactokinase [Candidatus Acidoferrum sp.]
MNPDAGVAELKDSRAIKDRFYSHFQQEARLFRAPGRVNLIGEHTDYNEGFVLPAAIDLYCWTAIAPRRDTSIRVYSENFSESAEMDLAAPPRKARGHWSDYIFGVVQMLQSKGARLTGANLLICSDVPLGSGLSSSAALETCIATAFLSLARLDWPKKDLARLCQRAENEYVGARVGIMDQFACLSGEELAALMLDCRSLSFRTIPLPPEVKLVASNTMIKHALAAGEYNERRIECEEIVRRLSVRIPGIASLRDVALPQLNANRAALTDTLYRRARHVITENARVQDFAAAMTRRDLQAVGPLLKASHASLRDDYEVSCRELDLMVSLNLAQPGVIGARMTGGGFGGCTISLVEARATSAFVEAVRAGYQSDTGVKPEIYVLSATSGARECIG